ncbi:MAG: indole-3-glycerol phosphate synthase TrpC [Candidatus Dormibacteria bacterium]
MADFLSEIFQARQRRLVGEMVKEPLATLRARAVVISEGRRPLRATLATAQPPAVIAEIKRASPSAGLIAPDFDPAMIGAGYQAAGADAVSVLTEADYFQGHLSLLPLVREHTTLPLLRKDFLSTPYEVVQSAAYGADAILAIAAGLTNEQLSDLLGAAREWSLDVLVEVHTVEELNRALALEITLLGINNRDLRTLQTDPEVTERLVEMVPSGVLVVSESGFQNADQVERIYRRGVGAFLVGEALMRSSDQAGWVAAVKAVGSVEV